MTVLAGATIGAGMIGFLVVVALGIAAFFLFRSMTKHLRKVPKSFDNQPRDPDGPPRGPHS